MTKYTQLSDCPLFQPGTDVEVWYMKDEVFRDFNFNNFKGFDPKDPSKTHILLGTIAEEKHVGGRDQILENLFRNLQGEFWSPNVEANELILSKRLSHTSMSVGDCIRFKTGEVYLCKMSGWQQF